MNGQASLYSVQIILQFRKKDHNNKLNFTSGVSTLNGTIWKGMKLRIEDAKPDYKKRYLYRENIIVGGICIDAVILFTRLFTN